MSRISLQVKESFMSGGGDVTENNQKTGKGMENTPSR